MLGKPSGAAALSTMARLLPIGYRTELIDYVTVKAVGPDAGWVGLVGMRFFQPAVIDDDE